MKEVEKAVKKSVIYIGGQEDVLRARAIAQIFELTSILPDDFDVQVFDAPSSTPLDWVGSATTAPFLAERRLVLVRHLLQIDAPKGFDYFGKIGSSGLLVLVADSVGGTDDRKSKAATNMKNWEALITSSGGALLKYEPDPKATKELVKTEVSKMGAAISEIALTSLLDITGGSFSRAAGELEKLVLFVGPNVTISERHVEAVAIPSRDYNVYKLTDAIVERNPGEALRQLRILVGNVSRAEDFAFQQILPQMSRNLKLLWLARLSIDMSESLQNPSEKFKSLNPKRPSLLTEPPYRQQRYLALARRLSLHSLARALSIVADTDARLKGSLPNFSATDSLEMMVLDISSAFA